MTLADNGFSRGTKLNKTPRRQNRRAKTDLGIQRLQPNDLPVIISGVKEFRRLGTDVMFIRHRSWGQMHVYSDGRSAPKHKTQALHTTPMMYPMTTLRELRLNVGGGHDAIVSSRPLCALCGPDFRSIPAAVVGSPTPRLTNRSRV